MISLTSEQQTRILRLKTKRVIFGVSLCTTLIRRTIFHGNSAIAGGSQSLLTVITYFMQRDFITSTSTTTRTRSTTRPATSWSRGWWPARASLPSGASCGERASARMASGVPSLARRRAEEEARTEVQAETARLRETARDLLVEAEALALIGLPRPRIRAGRKPLAQ